MLLLFDFVIGGSVGNVESLVICNVNFKLSWK